MLCGEPGPVHTSSSGTNQSSSTLHCQQGALLKGAAEKQIFRFKIYLLVKCRDEKIQRCEVRTWFSLISNISEDWSTVNPLQETWDIQDISGKSDVLLKPSDEDTAGL